MLPKFASAAVMMSLSLCAFAADAPKDTPVSRYAAERHYDEVEAEKNRIQKEIATLTVAISGIERSLKDLNNVTFNRTATEGQLTHLRIALTKLDALPPQTVLSPTQPAMQEMLTARGEIWATFTALDNALGQFRPTQKAGSGEIPAPPIGDPVLESIKNAEPADKLGWSDDPLGMPNINRIEMTFYQPQSKSALDAATWKAALLEAKSSTVAGIEERFNAFKQNRVSFLNGLMSRFKNEIELRNKRLEETSKTLSDLDSSLKDEKKQQSELDTRLVFAVYFMILALLLLFFSLRLFPDRVAGKVVENRSLVEVTSMAFMLLTIIILGTGNKLGPETLGTLLGTIAGYIFGKKMGETNHVPHPQPEAKPEPKKKDAPPAAGAQPEGATA